MDRLLPGTPREAAAAPAAGRVVWATAAIARQETRALSMTATRQTFTVRWAVLDADLDVRNTADLDTRVDLRSAEPIESSLLRRGAGG